MEEVKFDNIEEINSYYGMSSRHPLVTVVRLDRIDFTEPSRYKLHYGVYALWLKETKGCNLSYGRTPYDYDVETVTSFAPGQTVTVEQTERTVRPRCIGLLFHPALLRHTPLGQNMHRYEFFSYSSTEALHLSEEEVGVFKQVMEMMEMELQRPADSHTQELLVSHIELLLNYCLRFYDRQFVTRQEINHSVVKQFDTLLRDYIRQQTRRDGLPSVSYFAEKCCLSTGYFGQLVKAETGRTARDFINDHLLVSAKEHLGNDSLSVAQVSDRLGFEYPQHFVRFFKRQTGQTPNEFRHIC